MFVSQPVDGVIYVARRSLKGRAASPSEKTARVNIIQQAQEEVKRRGRN